MPSATTPPSPNAVDLSAEQEGGPGLLWKEVKKAGDPNAPALGGDTAHVHYVGTLASDGSKFDSSRDRGTPFKFQLGKGEVIKGWDVGVASMKVGELSVFTVASEWAYGANGSPPKIPADSTLIFEVELLKVEGEDVTSGKDGMVRKRLVKLGEGLDHPNDGSAVNLSIKGTVAKDGRVFDQREEVEFTLGEGCEVNVPRGLEMALEKMKKQETARIDILSSEYAWGSEGNSEFNIPASEQHLTYEVHLKSFARAKESWQLDGEQKLDYAKNFKDQGTAYFKKAKLDLASKKYRKIVDFLEHEISLRGAQEDERKSLLQAGRLNLVMCHLKQEEWIEARNICDKVLEESPECEKAFFRRGEALMKLSDHNLAKADFQSCLKLDPENKAAKNKVALCAAEIRKQKEKEKRTFANMFDKFAARDAKREEEALKKQKPLEINEWEAKNNKNNGDSGNLKVSGDVNMDIDLEKAQEEEAAENQENNAVSS